MREFGILGAEGGIVSSYSDITAASSRCRYHDCSHTGEPGCAVLAAVRTGEISREALDSFLKLKEESTFNDMSYAEKRKKDRDFGRYIKSAACSRRRITGQSSGLREKPRRPLTSTLYDGETYGELMPPPTSGRDFANKMQNVA
jgi:hypothetical protein